MPSIFNNSIGFSYDIFIILALWGVFIFMLYNLKKHCDNVGVKAVTFIGVIELLCLAYAVNFPADKVIPGYLCGGVLAMMMLGAVLGGLAVIVAGAMQWFMFADVGIFAVGIQNAEGIPVVIAMGFFVIIAGTLLNLLVEKREVQFIDMILISLTVIAVINLTFFTHNVGLIIYDGFMPMINSKTSVVFDVVTVGLIEGGMTVVLYIFANMKPEPELFFVKPNTTRKKGL